MKKSLGLFLCLTLMGFSLTAALSSCASQTADVGYDNYDVIKEVARAYDRQGAQIHYDQLNARRHIYASPEDATAQRMIYLDCSSYVNSCYREAFGVNVMPYEISEAAPQTGNFMTYARENPSNADVVGYWENSKYTTQEEQEALLASIRAQLEIGDLVVYRRGETKSTAGHVLIYMGEDSFLHSYAGSSYRRDETDPAKSYDSESAEDKDGQIDVASSEDLFVNKEHDRYLFRADGSKTVREICVLRPLARGLTPTRETVGRMTIVGLSMHV